MIKDKDGYLRAEVAGHSHPYLRFGQMSSCGGIEDGVSFAHAGHTHKTSEGGWVISFADFEMMYLSAKAFRSQANPGGAK